MGRCRVGIVIPAFNEVATIGAIVSRVSQHGQPIVVDDGSSDETGQRAMILGADVVKHNVNQGYDKALSSGVARAEKLGCEYVITMDADGQHNPNILNAFIQKLDQGADVVIGIRNRRQRLAEHVFAWVTLAKWGIKDPLCGMKAYRVDVYKELGHFDSYGSIGTELALYAAKSGKNIAQIAVSTSKREGEPRFGRRYSANKRILRALWIALCKEGIKKKGQS